MGDPSTIIKAVFTVAPVLVEYVKKALKKGPNHEAKILHIEITRRHITESVDKAKGVLDKWKNLDLERFDNLANTLAEVEFCGDVINYIFKNKCEANIEWKEIQKGVDELLGKLDGLIREQSGQPSNQPSGHEVKGEMSPGNVRRCLLYLSRFPKGYVFNRNRVTRLSVAYEFFAGDSSMPLLQQPTNIQEVAPNHFLIANHLAEQTSTWPERKYLFREALLETTESIPDEKYLSSLNSLGGKIHTLNLKELKFLYLKNLSLRNISLENEECLKKLSLLQYLDLKYTNVRGCDWLEGLEELQMLDLRYTNVAEVHEKYIEKLGKLQHLLLGYCPKKGNNMLAGAMLNTEKLKTKNLKTLRAIRPPKNIEEDSNVTNVTDLSVTGFKTEELKSFWDAVEKFKNLTSLGVAVTEHSDNTLQDCGVEVKKKLKRLRMGGLHSGFKKLDEFENLIDLTLSSHKTIDINDIPQLPKLFCLRLYSFCKKKTLTLGVQGFERLKKLVIGDMAKVETVQIASEVIETVDTLKLCNVPNFCELICLESNPQLHLVSNSQLCLLRRRESKTVPPRTESEMVPFKEVQKTIFMRGFESLDNIDFEKSSGLKIYHYDMKKQCYQEVTEMKPHDNQS